MQTKFFTLISSVFSVSVLLLLSGCWPTKTEEPTTESKMVEFVEPQAGKKFSKLNEMIFVIKYKNGTGNNFDCYYSLDKGQTWSKKIDTDQILRHNYACRGDYSYAVLSWQPTEEIKDSVVFQVAKYGEGGFSDKVGPIIFE